MDFLNEKPINPQIIINKCGEAMKRGARLAREYEHLLRAIGPNDGAIKDIADFMRINRAARDMVKRHGYGKEEESNEAIR